MAQAVTYSDQGFLPGEMDFEEELRKRQPAPQQQAQALPFDPSKVPGGVPVDWAQDFIGRNPGDYHRLESAFTSNGQPQEQQAPQYQTPTQQWNAQPAASPQRDELMQLLMSRATQGTAVSRTDPNIRQQVDPVVAQQERASRNYIDDIAERSGPLANIQGERRLAAERSGQAAGAFEAEVIGREVEARRQEILQSLQLYGSLMSQEEQMALQRELANLSATVQREGLGLQRDQMGQSNDQFLRELALREYDTVNRWDYNWAGLGG